ncbi:hypothetical protein EB118_15765 [bacterium]|nr:hypothetical protein [bacterium]NBX97298.1 hypothetical protein [bacterium]NDC95330.1 hypothetical protein [bacterium]NDD85052.1 hypothetical protein [bacterium]NDG31512.1 hypothetical protein [bacterium]
MRLLLAYIFIIIVVLAIFIALVQLWRAVKEMQNTLKHPKTPVNHALTPEDRRRAHEILQNMINKEANILIHNLEKDLKFVSTQLQGTLLKKASDNINAQVELSKQQVVKSTTDLTLILEKTASDVSAQITSEAKKQKQIIVEDFEKRMVQVVGTYIVTALGSAAAQTDQAVEALNQLEAHKDEIRKDLINE